MANKSQTQLLELFNTIPTDKLNTTSDIKLQDLLPDTFPNAQKVLINQKPLLYPEFGEFNHKDKSITVQTKHMVDQYKQLLPKDQSTIDALMSGAVPHEAAHAIWQMDLPNMLVDPSKFPIDQRMIMAPKEMTQQRLWEEVHKRNLATNKALGDYAYANDASHSFADAFSVYVSNPLRLKNLMPDVYNYFKNLTGFEYKIPK